MSESMGWASQLAIQPMANIANTTTFSALSFRLSFVSNYIQEVIELVSDEGLRGTRTRNVERIAQGPVRIHGTVALEPNVAELEAIMPFILGTASSAGSYVVADTLPNLYVMADFVGKVGTFTTVVNKATISGEKSQPINMTLDLVGSIMTIGNAGAFTSAGIPAIDIATRRYMFFDDASGITVNGVTYAVDRFNISIDNRINPTYMMGTTATDLMPTDRVVMVSVDTKYTSNETTLQTDQRAITPRTGSIAITNGTNTTSFTFGNLLAAPKSVVVPGRNQLRYASEYQAFGVGATKEIVVSQPA